jgi:hypothetical protein
VVIGEEGKQARSIELAVPLSGHWSALELGIAMGLYVGSSPVWLVGFDHDWLGVSDRPGPSYATRMERVVRLWDGFAALDALARERGVRVLNASIGGVLDVFERVPFEMCLSDVR